MASSITSTGLTLPSSSLASNFLASATLEEISAMSDSVRKQTLVSADLVNQLNEDKGVL